MRAKYIKQGKVYSWSRDLKNYFLILRKRKKTTEFLVVYFLFDVFDSNGAINRIAYYPDDEMNLTEKFNNDNEKL